jgi:hypothetical protein
MTTLSNLLVIEYPSGGFGFYVARLINQHINGVIKTPDSLEFDALGTSHLLETATITIGPVNRPTWELHVYPEYQNQYKLGQYPVIPACPGINFGSGNLNKQFPNITTIYYNDDTWPLVFYNCIYKAKQGDIVLDVSFNSNAFGSTDNWALRENYTLMLASSELRNQWSINSNNLSLSISVTEIIKNPKAVIKNIAKHYGLKVNSFDGLGDLHNKFLKSNPQINLHFSIIHAVENLNLLQDLGFVNSIYWQAVFNFYIQQKYQIEIPVNDYANWFTNTKDVVIMLNNLGVNI